MEYFEAGMSKAQEMISSLREILAISPSDVPSKEITTFIHQQEPVQQTSTFTVEMTKRTVAIIAVSLLATEVAWKIYKKYCEIKRKNQLLEVLFFSEESALCCLQTNGPTTCNRFNCSRANLKKILSYINSAKKSLDICMYLVTNYDIADVITKAYKRDVRVRVIVDPSMADSTGSQVPVFRKLGIKVRMRRSNFLMHHKFTIVDDSIIITGSLNWTMQALNGNYDNVIISHRKELVDPFVAEFGKLWEQFDGGDCTSKLEEVFPN